MSLLGAQPGVFRIDKFLNHLLVRWTSRNFQSYQRTILSTFISGLECDAAEAVGGFLTLLAKVIANLFAFGSTRKADQAGPWPWEKVMPCLIWVPMDQRPAMH